MAITKKQKSIYDKKYRKNNAAKIKAKKAAYFKKTYDPVKAAVERKKGMAEHIEYCRQPWYKDYKREYDKRKRLDKFGTYREAKQVLNLLQAEIRKQMPDRFERYRETGRKQWNPINQALRRIRQHGRNKSYSSELEKCPLVNP